jgi:cytochrome c-type biogenesis protein
METVLSALTRALEGQPALALAAAFAWGLASLLLSPCHLTSIPLVIGFVSGQRETGPAEGARTALAFSTGLLTTITAVGFLTAAMGRMLGDTGPWAAYAVAVLFVGIGLTLLDVVPLSWAQPLIDGRLRGGGWRAALVVGLSFGTALGPCTFAYMAPVLGVAFTIAASSAWYAALLVLAFGVGHCAPIVAAGASANLVRRYLRWSGESPGVAYMRCGSGVLVLAGALYLLYTA